MGRAGYCEPLAIQMYNKSWNSKYSCFAFLVTTLESKANASENSLNSQQSSLTVTGHKNARLLQMLNTYKCLLCVPFTTLFFLLYYC